MPARLQVSVCSCYAISASLVDIQTDSSLTCSLYEQLSRLSEKATPWIVCVVQGGDGGQQRMKALFDFEAIQDGDLSFRQGDKLLVTVE